MRIDSRTASAPGRTARRKPPGSSSGAMFLPVRAGDDGEEVTPAVTSSEPLPGVSAGWTQRADVSQTAVMGRLAWPVSQALAYYRSTAGLGFAPAALAGIDLYA